MQIPGIEPRSSGHWWQVSILVSQLTMPSPLFFSWPLQGIWDITQTIGPLQVQKVEAGQAIFVSSSHGDIAPSCVILSPPEGHTAAASDHDVSELTRMKGVSFLGELAVHFLSWPWKSWHSSSPWCGGEGPEASLQVTNKETVKPGVHQPHVFSRVLVPLSCMKSSPMRVPYSAGELPQRQRPDVFSCPFILPGPAELSLCTKNTL